MGTIPKGYRMKPHLPVIRNLGGCGSTLLGRIISALPGIVLLSETNPRTAYLFGGCMNPINQLRGWFPDYVQAVSEFDDHELGYPENFGKLILALHTYLAGQGRQLVIRDYNYVDFVAMPFMWPPANDLSLNHAVSNIFHIKDVVLVRYPADQLASLRSHRAMRDLPAKHFVDSYVRFLDTLKGVPIFRYEDILSHPKIILQSICDDLGLMWDEKALSSFSDVLTITGNFDRITERQISKPPIRDEIAIVEAELRSCTQYSHLLEMIGYV